MHAEVWNAPTWFLSALNFATAVMPFSLPSISKLTKKQLRKMAGVLFIIGLLPKIGYCYDHNAWALMEGTMAPKAMANLAIFNTQRFTPFHATIEVLLGAVACRLVMLDGVEGETKTNSLSTALPLLAMLGITALRAFEIIGLSDLLTRAIFFIPLFLNFLMAIHRSTVQDSKDALVKILNSKFLVGLGGLSFPMFIMHGPIGQLFYKKIIAKKLFGGPMHIVKGTWFFYVYLGCVLASAFVLKNTFLSSKTVGKWSKDSVAKISSWF
jgi:peptidoglycan/LPS O-acetylase OafA/YrhL